MVYNLNFGMYFLYTWSTRVMVQSVWLSLQTAAILGILSYVSQYISYA